MWDVHTENNGFAKLYFATLASLDTRIGDGIIKD